MGYKKGLEKYKIFGQLKLTLFGLKKKKKKIQIMYKTL